MQQHLNLFVTQFVTLYALLEPIGHLSLFVALTGEQTIAERRRLAVLSVGFAFLILIFFAVLGQALLHAMGVSIRSFQIAGGLILFAFALTMIFSEPRRPTGVSDDKSLTAFAIYPLATPTIAGPGAILSVVLLSDNNRHNYWDQGITLAVVAAMMGVLLLTFLAGDYITRIIGASGANLVRRIMGIVIAAFSVDVVLTAIARWLNLPPI
ncbi:MAG: MarC family transcriptional regulator [Azorhizobium sp. 35-67-5]|nr:MAG: MarC family transcriptional regulator [Azorhizobium sp. 35-67-5]